MNPVNLYDMEKMAQLRTARNHWDYVAGGATDEITLRRNREAFDEITLNPRLLVDVNDRDMSTTILGKRIEMPIMAAPTGSQWEAHPDAELGVARAAGAMGTLMGLATATSSKIADVAKATYSPLWYQLYHMDDEVTEHVLKSAEAEGFIATCLTVDGIGGLAKERDVRNNLQPNYEPAWADLFDRPDLKKRMQHVKRDRYMGLTWERLEWLKSLTSMKLVVKGVMTAEDALLCVEHGVDGIVVSNHGARVLDTVPATIEMLPAIAEAVGDRIEVYLDSGVRRGTDVLKALALGARAVLVGRPLVWGLILDGGDGVLKMFELLRDEFDRAMMYAGVRTLGEIDASLVNRPPWMA